MVKNDTGGNKGKGLARKHVNAAKCGSSKQLRVAVDEAEKYAIVSKMLGNGMCYVRLLDGTGGGDRLCIIRNKFKGRGKRDNILESGSWVLVGMREWSSKQDTCDLLEVYNPNERDRLLKNEQCFKSVSAENGGSSSSSTSIASIASNVQFADSTTMKYSSMLNKRGSDEEGNDEDDEAMMQQRVYDMPSSDDDDDDDDDDDSGEDYTALPNAPVNPVKTAPNPAPLKSKVKVAEINVDDI